MGVTQRVVWNTDSPTCGDEGVWVGLMSLLGPHQDWNPGGLWSGETISKLLSINSYKIILLTYKDSKERSKLL